MNIIEQIRENKNITYAKLESDMNYVRDTVENAERFANRMIQHTPNQPSVEYYLARIYHLPKLKRYFTAIDMTEMEFVEAVQKLIDTPTTNKPIDELSSTEKTQFHPNVLIFEINILNILQYENITTIAELMNLSPQILCSYRLVSPKRTQLIVETTAAWCDEQGIPKESYPLFAVDDSNKEPSPKERKELYSELLAIQNQRKALNTRIKHLMTVDTSAIGDLTSERLALNKKEEKIYTKLINWTN